jgi:hypothetical protein
MMALVTYRLEITLEVPREGVLPEIELIRGERRLGHLESLRSDVDVLEAERVRKVDERQGYEVSIETLWGETRQ